MPPDEACHFAQPDMILSCGDWGDPEEVTKADLESIQEFAPIHTTFGNHDPVEILKDLHNPGRHARLVAAGRSSRRRGLAAGCDWRYLGQVALQALTMSRIKTSQPWPTASQKPGRSTFY